MTETVDTLAARYERAARTYSTSTLGAKTDRAWATMTRTLDLAEKLGLADELESRLTR